jgi:hypothetical protein
MIGNKAMRAEDKLARQRRALLELAEELGSVSEACRRHGVGRTRFYEYKKRYAAAGLEGLKDLPTIPKTTPSKKPEELRAEISELALRHPNRGCDQLKKLYDLIASWSTRSKKSRTASSKPNSSERKRAIPEAPQVDNTMQEPNTASTLFNSSHPATVLRSPTTSSEPQANATPSGKGEALGELTHNCPPSISSVTIQKILAEHGLGTRFERWLALERQIQEQNLSNPHFDLKNALTCEQNEFLHRWNPALKEWANPATIYAKNKRHAHRQNDHPQRPHPQATGRPGQLLCHDIFFLGRFPGIGPVHANVVIDMYGSLAWVSLHLQSTSTVATMLLVDTIYPFYQKLGIPIRAILTPATAPFQRDPVSLNDEDTEGHGYPEGYGDSGEEDYTEGAGRPEGPGFRRKGRDGFDAFLKKIFDLDDSQTARLAGMDLNAPDAFERLQHEFIENYASSGNNKLTRMEKELFKEYNIPISRGRPRKTGRDATDDTPYPPRSDSGSGPHTGSEYAGEELPDYEITDDGESPYTQWLESNGTLHYLPAASLTLLQETARKQAEQVQVVRQNRGRGGNGRQNSAEGDIRNAEWRGAASWETMSQGAKARSAPPRLRYSQKWLQQRSQNRYLDNRPPEKPSAPLRKGPLYRGQPQINGLLERFHQTLLKEFTVPQRKRGTTHSITELQVELDFWLEHYNTERPFLGFPNYGACPREVFWSAALS